MIRTRGFLCFLAFLASGCAPSDPNESRYATPIGPLADDYQDRVKTDLAHTLVHSEGAIYTFDPAPSIVNLGKRRAGVHYAWDGCGTVNAKNRAGGYAGANPSLSAPRRTAAIRRQIDTCPATECGNGGRPPRK